MANFVAMMLLQPCAMLAKGPPWMKAGVPSNVCTKLGCSASCNNTAMALATPKSFTQKGLLSNVTPSKMFSMRRCKSFMSVAKQRMAISSLAGVMSKPLSRISPLLLPPKPVMMLRRLRSFTSSTRRHTTSFSAKPSRWC